MIRELKTLIAVAGEGNFAAAGDKVGLTQAAVSAQMQRLERALGFDLFDRAGRSARLNKNGLQVLAQAQELVRLYNTLGTVPADSAAAAPVVIGSIASMQRTLLPDALARFHALSPGCHTRILPGVSLDLLNRVDAGEIDMALMIRPPFELQTDLLTTTLYREPFRLLVPRDIPGDDWSALLTGQAFVRYDRASFGGRLVDRFLRAHHLAVQEVCEADELEAIAKLVANGVGIALLPEAADSQGWPDGVRVLDLGAQTFHRDIVLLSRAEQTLSQPAQALARLIRAHAEERTGSV